jgi:3-polyprenyl-4-hydroxybenzoate decarboxylase
MPAFYNLPETLDDMVDHTVMRILDQFGIAKDLAKRWDGEMRNRPARVRAIKANDS